MCSSDLACVTRAPVHGRLAQRAARSMAAHARLAWARSPRRPCAAAQGETQTGGRIDPAVRSCGEIKAGLTRARPAGRRQAGADRVRASRIPGWENGEGGACEPARRQLIAGHPASGHARPGVHACTALRAPRSQCSASPVPGLRTARGHGWPQGSRAPRRTRTESESVRGGLSSRKLSALLVVIIATFFPAFRWEASCALTWA